jgi:hypothetical protein
MPDNIKQDKIDRIRDLRKSGYGLKHIAKLEECSPSTVKKYTDDIVLTEYQVYKLKEYQSSNNNKSRRVCFNNIGIKTTKVERGNYNPKATGDITEAVILSEFVKAGKKVLIPFGDKERYDMVVHEDSKFITVQCKTARFKNNGKFTFSTSSINWNTSVRTDYVGEVDVFAVYVRELNKVYIYSVDNCPKTECTTRVFGNKQKNSHLAEEHEFLPEKKLIDYK